MDDLPIYGCLTKSDAQLDKIISESSSKKCKEMKHYRKPRGLINLGNTCYYNSVLQCLAHTPFLKECLLEISEPGKPIIMRLDNEEITMQQEKWSQLMKNLYITLQEITNEYESKFTPNALLDEIKKKCNMFIGYNQHDSHELLRHILDSVRDDDLQRYQRTIVNYCSLSMRNCPSEDEKIILKIHKCSENLQDILLLPDHVFKGQLLSVVQCQTCGHKSETTESFLDLSLPIIDVDKVYNNMYIKDNMEIEMFDWQNYNKEYPVSGHGFKNQPSNVTSTSISITELTALMESVTLTYSDRQMEADQITDSEKPMDFDLVQPGSPANSPSSPQGSSIDSMHFNVSPDNMDVGIDGVNENPERYNPTSNVCGNNCDGLFDSKSEEKSEFSQESPQATLKPQPEVDDDKCSVLTCLNQFFASETMTGNNKVACEKCTEIHKQETKEDKTIYRQITKQMLISSPPAILILHLKRFQMDYSTTSKITKDVLFPWVLDIAPYSSVKCPDKLSPDQNRILYSLYGVVEHTGSLNYGHYLAYIKVRDPLEDDSYRVSFLEGSKTKPPKVIDSNDDPSHLVPSGTWYSVNDVLVTEVTPNHVQNCQAYLLFYERIL